MPSATSHPARQGDSFGNLLKTWRLRRGLSQLAFAEIAATSQRHISFLESGRSQPSRPMILQLAASLDLPLHERNTLLAAAGFAAVFRDSPLEAAESAFVRQAIELLLAKQEPYPAALIDCRWNQLRTNRAGEHFSSFLMDEPPPAEVFGPQGAPNLIKLLLHPRGLRSKVVNWLELSAFLIQRLRAEALRVGGDALTERLFDEIACFPDMPEQWPTLGAGQLDSPVLMTHFRKNGIDLRFFTTITTLGAPLDAGLEQLRLESYFPADEATEAFMRQFA
ncbi:helix-turn-helix domain-containing protein [Pseudomonas sp. F(2018)]|uniref:helix-turn-helix domain-containing protein n=1 Tax=Pseudomonas sp. F(2018) TaxID=2502240 RepID=UPI0010F644AE|nr:helix-turn-helix transcriptional regulator [Pseudomonas sp. F(2018)]